MVNNYLKKCALVIGLAGLAICSKAQVVFYTEDLNSGSPTGFSSTTDWVLDNSVLPVSNGYTAASGDYYYAAANGSGQTETLTLSGISTLAFTNVGIQWGAYKEALFPGPVTFEWSADGSTWNSVSYTDVANDATWAEIPVIALPSGAAGQANLQVRWIYTSNNNGFYFALDDIRFSGNITTYFSKSSGNLDVLGTWGTNPDGTGISPSDFTTAGITYSIMNNTAPTLGANWTVSGLNSKVVTGDAVTGINFTIPSGASFTGSVDVTNNSTVSIVNTNSSTFTFATLSSGSTVDYAATGAQTMQPITYQNLRISGSGAKSYANNVTVQGVLNISAGTLQMVNSAFRLLTLNGTITGSGTISGSTGSRLAIGGTGAFGTLNFTSGAQTLHSLNINRAASGVVTLGTNLTVGTNFQHSNGILNLNGMALSLNSTAGLTFPTSATNGSLRGSTTSTLNINGSGTISNSLFMEQSSSTTRALGTLLLNRSGQTLTLGNALDIYESATPNAGTLASAGNLTLKSSATTKARIGIIPTAGSVTGNVTVEVFKPSGATGWVNLCSGGVTGQTFANWNTSFAITCPSCPNGSVVGSQAFTSVYSYDETQGAGNSADPLHYIELQNTSTSINSYMGYWVYLGNNYPNTSAITIPLTGGVNTKTSGGSFNLTLTGGVSTENGWNLIANPYPSPILVSQIVASAGASNVDNSLLVYDPDTDANIVYSSSSSNSIIPMGQAFMIRALTNGVSVTPSENWKTTSNSNVSIQKATGPSYNWSDFLLELSSTSVNKNFSTQAYFDFSNGSSTSFDNGRDALSIASSVDAGTPRIVSVSGNIEYVRNSLAPLSGVVSVPVKVATGYPGVYSINPVNINKLPAGACVALYDIAKNITHDLKTGPYTTTVSANATTHQFELKITLNPTSLTSNVNNPVCANDATGFIKAQGTSAGPWNYIWKDASSNVIQTTLNSTTADTLKNITAGTYYVDVNTVGSCDNATGSFNVQASTNLPVALFSANTTTLYENSNVPVTFSNNSSNAVSYIWNFGDGSPVVTTPNASHVFNSMGVYNVTLIATNGACADSSSYTIPVSVMQYVGVSENSLNGDSFFVSKDENGVFVQLNFNEMTTADVIVTNVLGQNIAVKQIVGEQSKTYLSIPEGEKMIFITVVADGKKQTKKLIN